MAETENKKSALGEKLGRIARGTPVSMGFAAAALPPVPSMALVVKTAALGNAVAAARAGADALLVEYAPAPGSPQPSDIIPGISDIIEEIKAAASDIPVGLSVPPGSTGLEAEPRAAGDAVDFRVARVDGAPALILQPGGPRVFLYVGLRYPPILLRGLVALDIEGIVVENSRAAGTRLTVEDLVRYRMIADLSSKPIMAVVGPSLGPDDLVHLRDAGIEGALLDVSTLPDAEAAGQVGKYREAIDSLGVPPQRTRRGVGGRAPILPSIPVPSSMEVEPEEPDEDDMC